MKKISCNLRSRWSGFGLTYYIEIVTDEGILKTPEIKDQHKAKKFFDIIKQLT